MRGDVSADTCVGEELVSFSTRDSSVFVGL